MNEEFNELAIFNNFVEDAINESAREPTWFDVLVADCKVILHKSLVVGYWQLGNRIVNEVNLSHKELYEKKIVSGLSVSLGIHKREIWRAIQFYKKFPDLHLLPEDVTWDQVVNKYLPEGKKNIDAEPREDKALELLTLWNVKSGQVWKLGDHRLACGDCNDTNILHSVIQEDNPYLMLNDPPYGIGLDTDYSKLPDANGELGNNRTYSPIIDDDKPFIYNSFGLNCTEEFWFGAENYRVTIPNGGSWLVWDKRVDEKFDAMIGSGFELIWSKVKHKREIIRCNNTLFSGNPEAQGKLHPTMKPTKVIEWIVGKYSTKGSIVLDLYAGSGTTILACENLGRKCRAIEIDPKYVAVVLQRWFDATGKYPVLEGG